MKILNKSLVAVVLATACARAKFNNVDAVALNAPALRLQLIPLMRLLYPHVYQLFITSYLNNHISLSLEVQSK